MSTEIHAHPADTSVTEDLSTVFDDMRKYYYRNKSAVLVVTLVGVALVLNRSILRRELRRLHFSAEFFPYEEITDDVSM